MNLFPKDGKRVKYGYALPLQSSAADPSRRGRECALPGKGARPAGQSVGQEEAREWIRQPNIGYLATVSTIGFQCFSEQDGPVYHNVKCTDSLTQPSHVRGLSSKVAFRNMKIQLQGSHCAMVPNSKNSETPTLLSLPQPTPREIHRVCV